MEMDGITMLYFEGFGSNCPTPDKLPDMKSFIKSAELFEDGEGVFIINLNMKNCDEVDDYFNVLLGDTSMVRLRVDGSLTGMRANGATFLKKSVEDDGMNHVTFRCLEKPQTYMTNIGFLDENLITYEE